MTPALLLVACVPSLCFVPCPSAAREPAQEEASRPARGSLPVPESAALEAKRQEVREAFAEFFAAKGTSGRRDLRNRLLDAAQQIAEDSVGLYAFLDEALRVSTELGDEAAASEVIERIASSFDVDPLALRATAMVEIAPKVRVAERDGFCARALDLADECLAHEDSPSASSLLDAIDKMVRRSQVDDLKERWSACRAAAQDLEEVRTALARLDEDPEDSGAHATVGSYYCFRRGDFELGLPHLVKGSNEALRKISRLELEHPTQAEPCRGLAEAWMAFTRSKKGDTRRNALERALHWYRIAERQLDGIERLAVSMKAMEVESALDRIAEAGFRAAQSNGSSRGPDALVPEAAMRGLRWLADHQDENGSWDADEFFERDPEGDRCDGAGQAEHDVGVSGLALMALLDWGNSPASGRFRSTVARGLDWLRSQQEESGLIGDPIGSSFLYDHALATIALCEALSPTSAKTEKEAAQRAIGPITRSRNPYGAWRYRMPPVGNNDTSVTGWMIQALDAAAGAGLTIDAQALPDALGWIDEVTDRATGRVGYDEIGSPSSRVPGVNDRYPIDHTECMTAVGLLCRFLIGQDPDGQPIMDQHATLLLKALPEWDPDGLTNDLIYWLHGTLAMARMRPHSPDKWTAWKDAVEKAVLAGQRSDGSANGSWDPNGPWGFAGGRVYATAMAVLTLSATRGKLPAARASTLRTLPAATRKPEPDPPKMRANPGSGAGTRKERG